MREYGLTKVLSRPRDWLRADLEWQLLPGEYTGCKSSELMMSVVFVHSTVPSHHIPPMAFEMAYCSERNPAEM
jgi:hypothetical protein